MKDKNISAICISLIFLLVFFPLLWLIQFPPTGIQKAVSFEYIDDVYADYVDVPVEGMAYSIYEDLVQIDSGITDASGSITVDVFDLDAEYEIRYTYKNVITTFDLGFGNETSSDLIEVALMNDVLAEFRWTDNSLVGTGVDITAYIYNGSDWIAMSTRTTASGSLISFFLTLGTWAYGFSEPNTAEQFTLTGSDVDLSSQVYHVAPTVGIISMLVFVIAVITLIIFKKLLGKVRGKPSRALSYSSCNRYVRGDNLDFCLLARFRLFPSPFQQSPLTVYLISRRSENTTATIQDTLITIVVNGVF